MGGFDTEYPTSLDPVPAELLDGADYLPSSALKLLVSQILAMQAEIGNDPVDFSSLGGKALDYGTIAAFLTQCLRIEGGVETVTLANIPYEVTFTAGRFSAPPFVILTADTTSPSIVDWFFPKKITKDGFIISFQGLGGTRDVQWVAIQGLFGVDEHEDES